MKVAYLYFYILFFFSFCMSDSLAERFSGKIESLSTVNQEIIKGEPYNVINMGPCAMGDELQCGFRITNTGTDLLHIVPITPSHEIGRPPYDNQSTQFQEYEPLYQTQVTIQPTESIVWNVKYDTKKIITSPFEVKEAIYRLGLKSNSKHDGTGIVEYKEFILRAIKTNKIIDGYQKHINFDSIYVNPISPLAKYWKVKNVTKDNSKIFSQKLTLLTNKLTKDEFTIQDFFTETDPLDIKSKKTLQWKVSYFPRDLYKDSASFSIAIEHAESPSIKDTVKLLLTGAGVLQKIDIINSNFPTNGDTILVGDIQVGFPKKIHAAFINNGNLPFGILNQALKTNDISEKPSPDCKFINKALPSNSHLQINQTTNFDISCSPHTVGEFVSQYAIHSDIIERHIQGVPDTVRNIKFFIKGNGIAPAIIAPKSPIDLGNVILNRMDCPSSKDSILVFKNEGNDILKINFSFKNIAGSLTKPNYFDIVPKFLEIKPNASKQAELVFSSPESGIFDYTSLLVSSNALDPMDEINIKLKAISLPPIEAQICIPDIKAKPGRVISIPIILKNEKFAPSSFASKYSDTIYFEPTLLKFKDYQTVGTASENVPVPVVNTIAPGKIYLSLTTPGINTFLAKDTLIKLRFHTYLGNSVATSISLFNPKFGNSNCPDVLSIPEKNIKNGSFTLDSICGLDFKTSDNILKNFDLKNPSPNPAESSFELKYKVGFKTLVTIEIYDSYGKLVKKILNQVMPQGDFFVNYPINGFIPGIYYIRMKAGIFNKVQSVIINR